jgi:hypothetical protein
MRKRNVGNTALLLAECIGELELTRGTETSKYPQENKETSIPSVAASESGTAQTGIRPGVAEAMRGYKTTASQSVWNVAPKRVTVP